MHGFIYDTTEFGFDELGLLDMSCAFTAAYGAGGAVLAAILISLRRAAAMHELHWLLALSYAFFAAEHFFNLINYVRYSRDGLGSPG